jgi:hypothetical protein
MTGSLDAHTVVVCLAVGIGWWLVCFIVDRLSGRGGEPRG